MQVIFVDSQPDHKLLFHMNNCRNSTTVSQLYELLEKKGQLQLHDELFFYVVPLQRDDRQTTLGELLNDRQNVFLHQKSSLQKDECACKLKKKQSSTQSVPTTITIVLRKADSDETYSVAAYDWLSKLNLMLKKLSVLSVLFRH